MCKVVKHRCGMRQGVVCPVYNGLMIEARRMVDAGRHWRDAMDVVRRAELHWVETSHANECVAEDCCYV